MNQGNKPRRKIANEDVEQEEQHAVELLEICGGLSSIEVDNILHAAKVQRVGELHVQRGRDYVANAKAEEG